MERDEMIVTADSAEDMLSGKWRTMTGLVRCKDCKECEERHTANYLPFLYCKLHEHSVSYNAFCWWAERREDETN